MTAYSPDDTDQNADWSKKTWDLPKTISGFMAFLSGQAGDNDRTVEEQWRSFQDLPSSRAMPDPLRREVEAILYGGSVPFTMVATEPRQVVIDDATGPH